MHVYEVAEQAAYHVGYGSKNTACRTVLNDSAAYAQYVSKNSHERRLSECTYGTWVRVHGTLCVCVCVPKAPKSHWVIQQNALYTLYTTTST